MIGVDAVSDEVVITFTETFYSKLWQERSKICTCFEAALLSVEINHGKEEAEHFSLFTSQ